MTDPKPIFAARQPIGTYDAVPYFDHRRTTAADGHPQVEVMLADGTWLLVDTARDLVPGFELDALPDRVHLARSYGEPWNGFATPVVDREVLAALLAELDVPHRWSGDRAHVRDEEDDDLLVILGPDAAGGGYDTAPLGWMLSKVSPGW